MATKIEWCAPPGYIPETWNPTLGCMKQSPGCENCYAMRMANRLQANPKAGYNSNLVKKLGNGELTWTGEVQMREDFLKKPYRWKKSRFVFVNSMSDLFWDNVPNEFIHKVLNVIVENPQHIFMILTKFPKRMKQVILDHFIEGSLLTPIPNLILGVSVENQKTADERIHHLLDTMAACRAISAEPLLGPIDWGKIRRSTTDKTMFASIHASMKYWGSERPFSQEVDNPIDWIIIGGESGPGARPMHGDWAGDTVTQFDVDYKFSSRVFFKQWGEWMPLDIYQKPNEPHFQNYQGMYYEGVTLQFDGSVVETKKKGDYFAAPFSGDGECSSIRVGKKVSQEFTDRYSQIFRYIKARTYLDRSLKNFPQFIWNHKKSGQWVG